MKSKTSLFNKAVARRNLTGHMGLWAGCLFIWLMILPLNVYFQTGSVIRFSNMELLQAEELAEMKSSPADKSAKYGRPQHTNTFIGGI